MPQLVPFYFLNEVFFAFTILTIIAYMFRCVPLACWWKSNSAIIRLIGGLAFFIFKFLDAFNYNSAIPCTVNSGKGKYTIPGTANIFIVLIIEGYKTTTSTLK